MVSPDYFRCPSSAHWHHVAHCVTHFNLLYPMPASHPPACSGSKHTNTALFDPSFNLLLGFSFFLVFSSYNRYALLVILSICPSHFNTPSLAISTYSSYYHISTLPYNFLFDQPSSHHKVSLKYFISNTSTFFHTHLPWVYTLYPYNPIWNIISSNIPVFALTDSDFYFHPLLNVFRTLVPQSPILWFTSDSVVPFPAMSTQQ